MTAVFRNITHFSIRITRRQLHTTRPLQSAAGSWTFTAIAVTGGILYALSDSKPNHPQSQEHSMEPILKSPRRQKQQESLYAKTPGRSGTLTPEQDEKLRQLWVATFQVFGVLDSTDVAPDNVSLKQDDSKKDDKKKRKSMFSKNKDTKEASDANEDKYGQTKEFHDALANLSPEVIREHFWATIKQDNPDAFLLRFLRARKWDVEKALVMMISTIRWRAQDVHVDDEIMLNGEMGALQDSMSSDPAKKKLGADFMAQLRLGKSFVHGCDKVVRPVCYVRVRLHKAGEQSQESMERYTVFQIESTRLLLSGSQETACVVFDMTGFALANMDYAPVKFMIKCFEANYPESLGVVLVHKAPWVFQGIWKIIRGWLDPVVASKIQFTKDEDQLREWIADSMLPKELGGKDDWQYSYVEPAAGENDLMKDTATRDSIRKEQSALVEQYEAATIKWANGEGTEEVKERREELIEQLRQKYWKLDPYIRARTMYDRVGMIGKEGKINFFSHDPRRTDEDDLD